MLDAAARPLRSDPAMDVARRPRGRRRVWLTLTAGSAALIAAIVAWPALTRSGQAGFSVDRGAIVTDVVRVGPIDRSIAESGVLASETVRVVSAGQPGIVTRVLVKPAMHVNAGDAVAQLDNPDLDAAVVAAQSAVRVASAQLASAREEAQASALSQQSALANAQAQMQEDQTTSRSLESLHAGGLVADQTYRIAKIHAGQSQRQVEIDRSQIGVDAAAQHAKVAAAAAQLDEALAQLSAHRAQVAALVVRSGGAGVVQSVGVDAGAHVDVGSELARVADQRSLKAVLQVPESQVHDVALGMAARVDTGNGVATGRVAHIAPAAKSGTVAVDVAFARPLPDGARPDLNVDGTIELERIAHTLSIARPAGAVDDTSVQLFRVAHDGMHATPVRVRLGRGSAARVQVLSGLAAGDTVIISDTSAYDGQPALRLHGS